MTTYPTAKKQLALEVARNSKAIGEGLSVAAKALTYIATHCRGEAQKLAAKALYETHEKLKGIKND